jgi:hypothetical protein
MGIINLGVTDGLPSVNWANVVEKLDAESAPVLKLSRGSLTKGSNSVPLAVGQIQEIWPNHVK